MIRPRRQVVPRASSCLGIAALTRGGLKELKRLFLGETKDPPVGLYEHFSYEELAENSPPKSADRAEIKLKLLPGGQAPTYSTPGSVGMDLYAAEDAVVHPLEVTKVRLGFSCQLPANYELQIRPRSGLAAKGIMVVNSPGTIDPDYRGEVCVLLSRLDKDDNPYVIKRGDRIAQGVLTNYSIARFEITEELDETQRGPQGFGSTGT